MTKPSLIFAALLLAFSCHAQTSPLGARYEGIALANMGAGSLQVVSSPTLKLCTVGSTVSNCAQNPAQTYTDSTLSTACPPSAPVVLAGSTTCSVTGDAQGNFGFWVAPQQNFSYTIAGNGVATKLYSFTSGGGQGGGGGGSPVTRLLVVPSEVRFGTLQTNLTSNPQNISINNVGNIPVVISGGTFAGSSIFSSPTPNFCNGILGVGGTCILPLTAHPTAIGDVTGTYTVNSTAPIDPQNPIGVSLFATGTASPTFPLSVAAIGTGSGVIQSNEATPLINCTFAPPAAPSGACSNNYASGSVVILTATPLNGGSLGSISGAACSGSPCSVTVTTSTTVTATFNPPLPNFIVSITGQGLGVGSVISNLPGAGGILNCTSTAGVVSSGGNGGCSGSFPQGTVLTLIEGPGAASAFAGWSGPCTGTSTSCVITVGSNVTVGINYTPTSVPLSLTQSVTNCSTASSSIACNWGSAQIAGDLLMCVGAWPDASTTVSSISDTKGNTYTQFPTISPKVGTVITQVGYYAQNILAATAGSNTTTMNLSAAVGQIAGTNLTAGGSTTPGTTFTTASITPTANRLVLISVASHLGSANGPGPISTITGNSLTWVLVSSLNYGATTGTANTNRLEVWRAMASSTTTGATTITFAASPTAVSWTVSQFTGMDTSGSNGSGAIGITTTNPANSATASPLTVTMGAFGSATSGTFGAGATDGTSTLGNGTSMTLLGSNAASESVGDEFATGNVSPVTMTYSGAAIRWGVIGIEIKVPTNRRDMRCLEYSGVKTIGSPIDQSIAATGTSALPATGTITTTQAADLLTGFTASLNSVSAADTSHNWVQRLKNTFGDDEEDQQGVNTGTYNFQPTLGGSANWVAFNIAWLNNGGGTPGSSVSLTLTGAGGGSGLVSGNAGTPSLSCSLSGGVVSGPCSTSVSLGSSVTLTAQPVPGSAFFNWTGVQGCGSSPICIVPNITSNSSVIANFTLSGVQNYYVNVSTGSDSNSGLCAVAGTPAGCSGPWATLNKSVAAFTLGAGGTVVNVAAGTYSNTSGSACFTSVLCDNRGGASLTRRLIFSCTTPLSCFVTTTIWLQNVNFVDVTGFDGGNLPNSNNALASISTSAANGNSLHIYGNYFHDVGQNVSFGGISGCTNDGMVVMGPAHGAAYSNTDLQVTGNLLFHYGTVGNGCNNGHGIYIGSGGALIQNNIISNITTTGIETYDQPCNQIITNNTIYHSGRGIQVAGGSCSGGKNTIDNNIVDGILGSGIVLGSGSGSSCVIGGLTLMSNNVLSGNTTNFLVGANSAPVTSSCEQFVGNILSEAPSSTFVNYVPTANGVTSGNVQLQGGSAAKSGGTLNCVLNGVNPCTPVTDYAGTARTSPPSIGAYQ